MNKSFGLLRRGVIRVLLCSQLLIFAELSHAEAPRLSQYQVDLGPPAASGAQAISGLPSRITTVTEWNACGREFDFLKGTQEKSVGEGMLSAVMGKILWLQTHALGDRCLKRVRFYLEELPAQFVGMEAQGMLHYFNERFRLAFDPQSERYDRLDRTRLCKPPVTSVTPTIQSDENGHVTSVATHVDVDFRIEWSCMRKQVNMALVVMKPADGTALELPAIGTEKLPCGFFKEPGDDLSDVPLAYTGKGDWDVNVRDLVRVLYLDRSSSAPILDTDTRAHVLNDLLTISGPLEEDSYSIYECGNQERDMGSPQERADERDFYEEGVFGDLGDLLDWLWNRILIFAAVAAALLIGYFVLGFEWLIPAAVIVGGLGVTVGFLRIPESENHLFMINTSRYLTNRLIIEALPDKDDQEEYEDDQEDIKEWLLDRLQQVATEDFREYNSRPYQRYTLAAIMNLHDFAADVELRKASTIVLDFAAAKFAAGSNQGRRIVPFRRLIDSIPADFLGPRPRLLFDLLGGGDQQIANMLLFAGQTQQLPDHMATINSAALMMIAASSQYRPHELILNVAANKQAPYEQKMHHDGYEVYSSTRSYLISAGGVQSGLANPPVLGFTFNTPKGLTKFDNDRGIAMPTVLIPSSAPVRQTSVLDFLRIDGLREEFPEIDEPMPGVKAFGFNHNLCVRRGFACGVNIVVPAAIDNPECLTTAPGAPDQWRFIDSAACPVFQTAPHFYVVLYRQACIPSGSLCQFKANWGFFEAINSPSLPFEEFKSQVIERNPPLLRVGLQVPSSLVGTYVSAQNERIAFDVLGHERDSDTSGVISVDNYSVEKADDWAFAAGGVIESDGDGHMKIRDPGSARWIEIDFSDKDDPKRTVH